MRQGPDAQCFDVTIVGGGPAGLFACFYSGLRGAKTKVIEADAELGGKLRFYREKLIWDVGGKAPVTGDELLTSLLRQARTFSPRILTRQRVTSIRRETDAYFALETAEGAIHRSKAIILAYGSGILSPRPLRLGRDDHEVRADNLYYAIPSLSLFRDRVVLISGGGHAAVDWARSLGHVAKQTVVVYRGENMRGFESEVHELHALGVVCHRQTIIQDVIRDPSGKRIEAVVLRMNGVVHPTVMKVDALLVCHGYEQDEALLAQSPLPIQWTKDRKIVAGVSGQTSEEGIYACGDVVEKPGKLYLLAGAFHDAIQAVNQAKLYLDPSACAFEMVSSHHERLTARSAQFTVR
ncbi:NAD(P)/FAD-dependent oxidoreductase [Alicyclobacillus sendaiensis]|uniref:NAD(P)/FAD-dependent oxidoreductase n=1 Tax=Alicyclobacillus sendaiensis TaxID=192387 RepID=UPI0026F45F6A|nr:NAD(P)/FAD-dependent oxidoreductase [Alicyclobacillus sendaiensis]